MYHLIGGGGDTNLYHLARDILAIPGSAVAIERIFSDGCDN